MLWAVLCIDKDNTAAMRDELRTVHRAYLDTQNPKLFFSGPLLSDDGEVQTGSLFVLAVKTRADAQTYIDDEPFNKAGVFASVRIFRMRKGRFHPDLVGGA